MRRHSLFPLALLLFTSLVLVSCSDDDGDAEPSDDDGSVEGIDDAEAEARSASLDFFGAQAVLDYEKAADRSSGAAALGVTWAEQVNSVQQVRGTPFEVQATPSPTVTVSFESVSDNGDGTWSATGYVELERYPGMLTPGPVPDTEAQSELGWFVTDLVFREDGDRLVVDDYRMDDSPYPVSQFFIAYDEPDTEVTLDDRADEGDVDAGVVMRLGHRDLDQTVQYTFDLDPGALDVDGAEFFADATLADAPPPESVGSPVELLRDVAPSSENPQSVADGEQDAGAMTLGVRRDAFPGGEGMLRVRFVDGDGAAVIIDAEVPEFGPLAERPTNTVRSEVAPTTTTSTTTTSTTTTPTTTAPPQVIPVPVPTPTDPTTTASPTTTTTTTAEP